MSLLKKFLAGCRLSLAFTTWPWKMHITHTSGRRSNYTATPFLSCCVRPRSTRNIILDLAKRIFLSDQILLLPSAMDPGFHMLTFVPAAKAPRTCCAQGRVLLYIL